jgi:HAD superfamily hydrolase (TIGR01509 family)
MTEPGANGRPALEAVVFDAGGTLVRLDFEWMASAVTALGHVLDPATLRRAEVEGRRRYDATVGGPPDPAAETPPLGRAGDTHAYFAGMLRAAGVSESLIEPVVRRWDEEQRGPRLWRRPMEGARAAIDGLRRLGLRLACVSNSDGRAEDHLIDAGVRDGLEFVVDSFVVGVEKPDPRIFLIALGRLALPAERTLYVGDIRGVDEVGSRAAGMHFVLVDPWGDYAAPGTPSIRGMEHLPAHVAERFTPPPRAREDAVGT